MAIYYAFGAGNDNFEALLLELEGLWLYLRIKKANEFRLSGGRGTHDIVVVKNSEKLRNSERRRMEVGFEIAAFFNNLHGSERRHDF